MNKKIKYIYLGIFIILLVGLGFFRDFLFVNINYYLQELYYKNGGDYNLPPSLKFINHFSYIQLYYGKWILTGLFSSAYFIISLKCIQILFKEKKYLQWTLFAYLFVGFTASLFYLYGLLFNDIAIGYRFSRIMMGLVQSPFVLMILIPAFQLEKK